MGLSSRMNKPGGFDWGRAALGFFGQADRLRAMDHLRTLQKEAEMERRVPGAELEGAASRNASRGLGIATEPAAADPDATRSISGGGLPPRFLTDEDVEGDDAFGTRRRRFGPLY